MDLALEYPSAGSAGPSAARADSQGSVLGLTSAPPPLDVEAVLMGVLVEEIHRHVAMPLDELVEEADAIVSQATACGVDDALRRRAWAHYMRVWSVRMMYNDVEDGRADTLVSHAAYLLQAFGCASRTREGT